MKNNFELVKIFNNAKNNIRNTPEYINLELEISDDLLEKANSADTTPVIIEKVSYGVREALFEDFKEAGYNVHLFDHSSIAVSLNFESVL